MRTHIDVCVRNLSLPREKLFSRNFHACVKIPLLKKTSVFTCFFALIFSRHVFHDVFHNVFHGVQNRVRGKVFSRGQRFSRVICSRPFARGFGTGLHATGGGRALDLSRSAPTPDGSTAWLYEKQCPGRYEAPTRTVRQARCAESPREKKNPPGQCSEGLRALGVGCRLCDAPAAGPFQMLPGRQQARKNAGSAMASKVFVTMDHMAEPRAP